MRTHVFNKMTAGEIDSYLDRGGDTIFVAVGVVECHGTLPVDCETIGPEAFATALAEKYDALALINLPYFYPGGTYISRATVHVSIRDGIDYLWKITKSLVDQGFKKIFFISGHGPAGLTIDAFCRDFFEKTHIHPCHLSSMFFMRKAFGGDFMQMMDKTRYLTYGAYKYMGQMEYIPIDPDAPEGSIPRKEIEPEMQEMVDALGEYGGRTSQVYSDPREHGGGIVLRSEKERLQVCTEGEKLLMEIVEKVDLSRLLKALENYHAYVARMAEKHPIINKI